MTVTGARAMSHELEHRINGIAAGQHGVVTRAQLLAAGLTKKMVGHRLRTGRLRALHGGVYVVGPIEGDRAADMAAVLAGGPTARLSHTSALRVWGMRNVCAGRVHVTVPGSGRGRRPGILFHRVAGLADDECAVVDEIPITSPGRTLVDVARMLGTREIELAAAVAEREGLIQSDELTALPDRYRGRPGMAVLRALFREDRSPDFTRSEAERRCLDLIHEAGLPRPHANVPVGPYELDLFWPVEGVAVEIDGHAHHSSRPRFEGDRRKDRWLHARGIQVVRLTWGQITRGAMRTAVEVGQILALARAGRKNGLGGQSSSRA